MKVAIVTDAWEPQVNGVVTTMRNTRDHAEKLGHHVQMITPDQFRSIPCPMYEEIRLSLKPYRKLAQILDTLQPDVIHVATEGPLGAAANKYCSRNGIPFTSSLHTRFPEYIRMRAPVPLNVSYCYLRNFHKAAQNTLVRTATQKAELEKRGFSHLRVWPGAVDTALFYFRGKGALSLPRPISMYMGRVSVEKGLDDFLQLDLPGTKVIVGGGPDFGRLKSRYPEAVFTGPKFGAELAEILSAADVFVFPSRTDTFGLCMLEAMACGVPVAAYPVPGPQDVVINRSTGILDSDLKQAIMLALTLDGDACIEFALEHSWEKSTSRFLDFQTRIHTRPGDVALSSGFAATVGKT
jgi:glycosyltransferase involved in cell wall biosynthesis